MAVCLPSLSDLRAERNLTEVSQEVLLELAKYKQDFRDVKEKLLISEATVYSLANQLQKNKCEACKDIVESVLGEKLMFEVQRPAEKLAEKPTLDERLRTCDVLIRSQARELTQLRQTLRDGKDDSVLLKQRLKDLLTHNDLDNHQGQGFRESLSEGYRLAERLACKFSPEIYEDEDDEQVQETLTPSMELQEVEKKEVPEECKDECVLMPSILQGSSDNHQPYSNDKLQFNELEVDLGPDGACGCSHAKEDEMPTNISDNENYQKLVSGQELTFPSVNLQDDEKKVVFQQPQDECVSVPSTLQEGSACNQPYSDGKFAFDEENVASAVDGACGCSHAEEDEIPTGLPENRNDLDDLKGPEVVAPRFSRQLPQLRENGVPGDSLDEYALTYSVLPSLSDSFWPYRSAAVFSLEGVDVSYARDVTKNLADLEDEEDQDIISSRVEQLVVEEIEVQPDSVDECYLAASIGHHLAGSCHPYRSASFPTESTDVFWTLNVNENLADLEDEEDQDIISSRVEQLVVEEIEVQPDSVDECYLAASIGHHLAGSCHPYRSASFPTESTDVFWTLNVNENLADLEDEEDQDIISSRVEQLVVEEIEVQPDSVDACYLAASIGHHLAGSCHPYRSASFPTESTDVFWTLNVNENLADLEDEEDQDIISSRVEQLVVEEIEVQPDPVDACYLAASIGHHLAGSCHPYRSASFPTESTDVFWTLNVNDNLADLEDEEDQCIISSRVEQLVVEEIEVQPDSVDECYLAASIGHHLAGSCHPYRSASFPTESTDVFWTLNVNENLADLEDEEDQCIISSRVEQLVVEEIEVQPDSVDECYLAASIGHHLAGSCHPYRSASFPTESTDVFWTLNVNGDTWEDCHQGPVSFPGSEVPTSQAQLQKSTHVTDCLQWQLDQHFDCGDSKAMLGLSSTNWGFTSNPDSGNQGPLLLDINYFRN
ncbi:neuroblastoma breakpoint family member 4-like isoform X2 [Moschus berezovskii]|uniref:neuroblastoma breakpoint family member 4-like isoform X2 n=1 Tax=Moschus berezovskii TaxID=68408 RepID=UPI0024451ACF|nr:neuroblastoma breakpoint family member 4-like isoform X2 [Moschus berezovskii]